MNHRTIILFMAGSLLGLSIAPLGASGQAGGALLTEFDSVLGFFHPDVLSGEEVYLEPAVVERLGSVSSSLQAAVAQEIANLSISSAGTQYFFGRDRMFYISGNLGTYFIEPPWTNGAGNGSLGINTAYLDFETFQNQPLSNIFDFPSAGTDRIWDGDYDLKGLLTSFSLTYGFTDRLDVGVIFPLVHLKGQGEFEFESLPDFPAIADFN